MNANEKLKKQTNNQTLLFQRDAISDDFFIDVFCQLDNCNNRHASEKIIQAVQNHYYIWTLSKFKSVESTFNIEQLFSAETSSTTTTTTTTTINRSGRLSFSNYVFILSMFWMLDSNLIQGHRNIFLTDV